MPEIKCSRIDVCLDDFTKRLTFNEICAALESKQHSGFQKSHVVRNYDGTDGWTVYLGSRSSEHMVRIYNKDAESKGKIKSIRWESEFKDCKAQSIFERLSTFDNIQESVDFLQGIVFGKVNFVERSDKNLERCSMLTWWAEFLAYVGYQRCQVLCEKPVTSIDSKVIWIKKQVERTLALLKKTFGDDEFHVFIDDCLESGTRRLKKADYIQMTDYLQVALA